MLVRDDAAWDRIIQFGLDYYPFSGRILTTQFVLGLNSLLGVSYRVAFIALQYSLMFLLGVSFFYFLRSMKFNLSWSTAGVMMLLASYPVLCAFHDPVYTREDFWEYLALVLCFWGIVRQRLILSALALTLGMVAREATVVFWPVFALGVWQNEETSRTRKWLTLGLPVVLFGLYALNFHHLPEGGRLDHFSKNFLSPERTSDSLYSLLVSFGVLWLTTVLGLARETRILFRYPHSRLMVIGALTMIPVSTFMALNFGLARETRLFFPPFVFMIPISLWYIAGRTRLLARVFSMGYGIPGAVSMVLSLGVGIALANLLFPTFELRGWPEFARAYLGVHLGLAFWLAGAVGFVQIRRRYETIQPEGDAISVKTEAPSSVLRASRSDVRPLPGATLSNDMTPIAKRMLDLAALFAFALILRLLYLGLGLAEHSLFDLVMICPDSRGYVATAQMLLEGGSSAERFMFIVGPGYPVVLALLRGLFGQSLWWPTLLNVTAGAAAPCVVYLIASALLRRRSIALLAGTFVAISLTGLTVSTLLLTDQLFFVVHGLSLFLFVRGLQTRSYAWFIGAGLLGGTSLLIRSIALFWPAALILMLALGFGFRRLVNERRLIWGTCITAAMIGLVALGWSARNLAHHDVFAFSSNGPRSARIYLAARAVSMGRGGVTELEVREEFAAVDRDTFGDRAPSIAEEYYHDLDQIRKLAGQHPGWFLQAYFATVWENMTVYNHLPRLQIPALRPVFDWIGHHQEHWLNALLQVLALLGVVLLATSKRRLAAVVLGATYAYFSLIIGFSFWQGSRLHYPAEMASSILLAFVFVTFFQSLRRSLKKSRRGDVG
jgi:hypothetical protein